MTTISQGPGSVKKLVRRLNGTVVYADLVHLTGNAYCDKERTSLYLVGLPGNPLIEQPYGMPVVLRKFVPEGERASKRNTSYELAWSDDLDASEVFTEGEMSGDNRRFATWIDKCRQRSWARRATP